MEKKLMGREKISDRKIVIINQAVNYLTIGICNAFASRFTDVNLVTGSIHVQGEELSSAVQICNIHKWVERPSWKKILNYFFATLRIYWLLLTRFRKHEVVFISLPNIAYLLALILSNRCSILIWDVYPDGFKITGMSEKNIIYRIWASANKKAFKKVYRLFTIGNKMADLLSQYTDKKKILITPIWSIFQKNERFEKDENLFLKKHHLEGKFIVQYSGNIGMTHKVELMIELAEKMKDYSDILFQIIGRGTRKPYLEQLVAKKQLPNCIFMPFQTDDMFPYSLSAANIGVVILDEITSKGSVPSKSYNLMSYGIPSLYISAVDSELNEYTKKFQHGICVCENELESAKQFILELYQNREAYVQYSKNSEAASRLFRRDNADKLVDIYISGHDINGYVL